MLSWRTHEDFSILRQSWRIFWFHDDTRSDHGISYFYIGWRILEDSVLRFLFHGGWRGRRADFLLLVTYVWYFLFWASDSHEDRDTSIFLYYDDCRGDFFTLWRVTWKILHDKFSSSWRYKCMGFLFRFLLWIFPSYTGRLLWRAISYSMAGDVNVRVMGNFLFILYSIYIIYIDIDVCVVQIFYSLAKHMWPDHENFLFYASWCTRGLYHEDFSILSRWLWGSLIRLTCYRDFLFYGESRDIRVMTISLYLLTW